MKLKATYDPPPIPDRRYDWSVVDDDTYDGPGCIVGFGPTQEAAIRDYMDQLETRKERT
jgi:hypothetical protein